MGDLKSKLRAKFTRRNSGVLSVSSSKSSQHSTHTTESHREPLPSPKATLTLPRETSQKGTGPDQNPDRGLESLSHARDGSGDKTDRSQTLKTTPVPPVRRGRGAGSHSGKLETQEAPAAATVVGSEAPGPRPNSTVGAAPEHLHDRDREASGPRHAGAKQGRDATQHRETFINVSRETTTITTTTTWSTDTDGSNSISHSNSSADTDDGISAPPSARDSTHTDTARSSNGNSSAGASGRASTSTSTDTTAAARNSASAAKIPHAPHSANADNIDSSSRPGQTNMPSTVHHLPSTGPVAPSLASAPDAVTPVPSVSGHRHQLSSIDEQATDNDKSPGHVDDRIHNPRADNTTIDPQKVSSSSAPAPADSLRRIHLGDPPANDSPSTNPSTNGLPAVRSASTSSSASRAAGPLVRQSLLPSRQKTLIRTLLSSAQADDLDPAGIDQLLQIRPAMATRKIWVRREGGSPTRITISEEDLVDDVKELILRKYANSLAHRLDVPDLTLTIVPRTHTIPMRELKPDEPMAQTMDVYFPEGQSAHDALLIDVPIRRTPKPSPRNGPPHAQHLSHYEDSRPVEAGTDYFGPESSEKSPPPTVVANALATSERSPAHALSLLNVASGIVNPHSNFLVNAGHYDRLHNADRPRLGGTGSPMIMNVAATHPSAMAQQTMAQQGVRGPRSRTHSSASSDRSVAGGSAPPPAPPLPTSPALETGPVSAARAATPPPRVSSPRSLATRSSKKKKILDHPPPLPTGLVKVGVPPINVLIVEDNIINLRLLEAFVRRLKVRWQTAMNGREAVTKWRTGGFHLVLMDIQLPVMSGLEATREIRRLERVNQIGAFYSEGESSEPKVRNAKSEDDILPNRDMFKGLVIIVALTASSLQSDRHEALAAGCNDFLTKPVTYEWLERKVREWGCMQALIDYKNYGKWKELQVAEEDAKKAKSEKSRSTASTGKS